MINNRNMVIKTRNGRNTQTWWFDQKSLTIRTKLNNQSWDIKSAGKTNDMQIWSTNSGWFQIFRYVEKQFCNIRNNNKCLDVHGGKDEEGRHIIVWNKHKGANQRWKIIYVDQADKIKTTGENEDFGFHVNRPFYIRSRLVMKRVVQCHGASTIKLNRYVKTTVAQWYFDAVSKTVRSNHWKNYAMQIPGNGGQNELSMTSGINSRWW